MSEMKLEATVTLGGEQITIKKLKAGKFYQAQKIIGKLFQEAAKLAPQGGQVEVGENADVAGLAGLFETLPETVSQFVALCADMEKEALLEKAYPEEISEAFGVCLELNNVVENLKNSIAPMQKLGQ